jgi:DNA (cytosine-5)-methyltransferase 1
VPIEGLGKAYFGVKQHKASNMNTDKLTVIDLFSGAGGLTTGFVRAGFQPIAAVEREPVFARTYEANFGCHVFTGNIEDSIEKLKELKADMVIGGPPCQGFSNLTLNKPSDPRRTLWQHFMDIVESSECNVFLMENVPNLLTSEEGAAIIDRAFELGFWVDRGVLLASRFGVPQNRKRAFILGSKIGPITLPTGSGQIVTVREAFEGIPLQPTVRDFPRAEKPVKTFELHIARNPTEISIRRYRLIPPGGNRFDLQRAAPELTPQCWIRKKSGGTDLYGRLSWDEPARCTIRTEFYKPEKGRYLHPQEHRPITHWEAARLQTFPDDFLWTGSKIEIAIQIGNAVPPKLAECLARHIFPRLQEHREQSQKTKRGGGKHVRRQTEILA